MSEGDFSESVVEQAALAWMEALGYSIIGGPQLAPGERAAERSDYGKVVLEGGLRDALGRLNPELPGSALDDAFRKLTRLAAATLVGANRAAHRMLVEGVNVEYTRDDGSIAGTQARVIDYDDAENNDWLVVNQFTVVESKHNRRPDVVVFVNGLPLAVIELKNPADANATIDSAFLQLQTYKEEIPSMFTHNAALVISDGTQARIGTVTSDRERFMPWRTISGADVAEKYMPELQVLLEGVFEKRRFLDMVRYFIVFEDEGRGKLSKKMAGYHQFHAVNVAVEETLRATRPSSQPLVLREERSGYFAHAAEEGEAGDRRIGVVWHTQGSGKSLTMAFYAGRIILEPAMENPTVIVLTDRNDLDDQLFGTFGRCKDLLRQDPVKVESRAELREKLSVAAGGVIFTTIQKFVPDEKGDRYPQLSDRRNIVVIADEAHRSQYEFGTHTVQPKDGAVYVAYGFAANLRDALPGASFIGFTGTPIELSDKNTRAVFGDYISVYDIRRSVEDGATVPIYYESRLAKLKLLESERPKLDPQFEEVTEGEELERKEKLKSRWAQLAAIVGSEHRLDLIAEDLVKHFEERLEALDGKAMVVTMSRRICMDLYDAIVKLRPEWHDDDDAKGIMKVVMTGSADEGPRYAKHSRTKERRKALADRFRDPTDPFKLVIVRDMWLTGFDAPSLHTMYIDKPMRGHGLMQAIARVNRVFRDKPGGLVVDYLGLAEELKQALKIYSDSQGTGDITLDQDQAVAVLLEKYGVCTGLFHGFDWSKWKMGTAIEKVSILPAAQEHILAQKDTPRDGKTRLLQAVSELSQAFALAVPADNALAIRDDVAFFQAVRSVMAKSVGPGAKTDEQLDHAIRRIISTAVASDEVIDIFAAAGLKKPDISILSDDFLAEIRDMPQRNLAVELLRRLLDGEIRTRGRKNVVQARSFAEMLDKAIRRYQNRAIETAQVIEELIALAKEMNQANARGEELGLSEDELAFYDALEANDSAVKVLGDDTLRTIARELVVAVKGNVSIDWTMRENVRAHLRVLVKRILRKYGYPPDKQEKATDTVLQQAEVLSEGWAAA